MKAIISSSVFLPLSLIDAKAVRKELTVAHWKMGEETADEIQAFIQYDKYLSVPRDYGLKLISKLGLKSVDRTSKGFQFPFPVNVAHTGEFAYQKDFVSDILRAAGHYNDFLVHAATGKGKCLAKGTPVLMYDGSVKAVERVRVGDLLMGPDSTPREVLSLARGTEEMFTITPVKGDAYTVNHSHVLSLRVTNVGEKYVTDSLGRKFTTGDIVDISVGDYLASSRTFKHCAKGWRTGVNFSRDTHCPIPPYILGTWLGDGSSRYAMIYSDDSEVVDEWRAYAASIGCILAYERGVTVGAYRVSSGDTCTGNTLMQGLRALGVLRNKHIPGEYLVGTRAVRLATLAGLIDTDGCVSCGCFDFTTKHRRLAEEVAFLARSLGYAAYIYPSRKRCTNTDVWGDYFRVRISGDIAEVPCRIPRKRAPVRLQKKNVLNVGISVSSVGVGEYYGFEIDGDKRFLLGDFTVTHNTVCSLSVIQKLGANAIVLVDQDNLMAQWKAQAKAVLGLKDEDIGTVQGKKCDYKGKAITIAMIQTLTQREYDEEFYDYFGTMVVDEVHTAGAPTFSQALMLFSATTRFGVSATVDRRDALQKILHWNLGAVQVALLDKHDKSYVYYLESGTVYSWYANISPKTGRMLSEVAEDTNRNLMLADGIKFMFDAGRDILVISDRIEQLEDLMAMCYFSGIPETDMGLYCGFRNVWGFEKDPKPKRNPIGHVRGTDFTPVKFGPIRKRLSKKTLEAAKASARVLFATFGMFAKGVDVPRLSAGFDCTPRSRAQQVHGRILRKLDGKFVPIWVTVRDYNSYRLEHQFLQRVSEYVESSAEIYKWKMEKGVRFQDVKDLKRNLHASIKELKALNILTQLDGNNTLVIPDTPNDSAVPPGTRTGRSTR